LGWAAAIPETEYSPAIDSRRTHPKMRSSHRQKPMKECLISLQGNAEILGRDAVSTIPLLFKRRSFFREYFRRRFIADATRPSACCPALRGASTNPV